MSPYPRLVRLLFAHRMQQYCCLLVSALFLGGQDWIWLRPAIAADVVIENQATGSYLNESTEPQTTQTVLSDIVTLTVAEVAGITITVGGVTGSTTVGGLAYFDFILTNVGNDPTQFFIPGAPSTITGGTQSGNITITSYDSDGNGSATPVALNATVPLSATVTLSGGKTGTLLSANPTANNGSIPAGGTIRIRVPIQISATSGSSVSVTMGNTTPANGQNQPYAVGTGNKDVYTVDNLDGTPGETNGSPVGEREASLVESLVVTASSPSPTLAGAPFTCDPYFYMLRNDGSGNSQLYKIDRQSSPYGQSPVIPGGFSPPVNLNALAYNPKDGYFYAMKSSVEYNVIYRIGKTNAVPLGVVINLPPLDPQPLSIPTLSSSFLNGTFDNDGNYYIRQLNTNRFYKVAIFGDTATASILDITGVGSSGDIAFNPVDRKIYAASQTGNSIAVKRIEDLVNTSAATTINITLPTTAPNIAGSIGSIFFDSTGTLYAYTTADTNILPYFYQMPNVASGASTVTQVSSAPDSPSSDGASCPFIPPRIDVVKDVGIVNRINATTFDVPFRIKVKNTGSDPTPNVQVTENLLLAFPTGTPQISLPTAPTITITPTGLCTLNPNFDGKSTGKMQLLTGGNSLPGGASCTIDLTARLVYSAAGSVPTTQNNSVYASTTAGNTANKGYTFSVDNTPILPPDLFDVDTSTNGSNLPLSAHADVPSPTPITFPTSSNPNVLLVKRITAINNQNFTTYQQENSNPYDDNFIELPLTFTSNYPTADTTKWPNTISNTSSTFLVGVISGTVKPKDSIEYTIYFLSTGDSTANNVLLCDRVPANVTFSPNTFTNTTANPSGVARGIAVQLGSTLGYRTNAGDNDLAQYFPPGIEPSTVYGTKINCGGTNNNGAVVVDLGNRPNAIGVKAVDSAAGAYGFVRFRGLVK
jgi:uncharacterized repeat protein (TIGR01451 family)